MRRVIRYRERFSQIRLAKLKVVSIFLLAVTFSLFSLKMTSASTLVLSGSVKDSQGNSISGATVSVNDANSDSTTTDSSGNYSLSIPSGTYNVQVTPVAGSGFSSAVAYSQNFSTNTSLNFILTPAGTSSLTGHLYDELGNPLTNQTVSLLSGSNRIATGATNASGVYSLSATAGTYTLEITNGSSRNTNFSQNIPEFYTVDVSSYGLTQDTTQDITLPAKKVSIHVQDSSINPLANVQATTNNGFNFNMSLGGGVKNVSGQDFYFSGQGPATDTSGNTALWLFQSTYNITATPPSGSGYLPTTVNNVNVASDIQQIITLQQPVTLSGQLFDELGHPLTNQTVRLLLASGSQVATATTNSSGNYSLTAAPGTYNIVVSGSNTNFSQDIPEFYSVDVLNYNLSQNTQQNITLPARKVIVHTQDTAGNPVAGVQLSTGSTGVGALSLGGGLNSTDGNDQYAPGQGPTTDASGNVTLWLLPTTYNLTATPPSGSSFSAKTVSNITITTDAQQTITLVRPVTLSGHIYDELGNPLAGQTIQILVPGQQPAATVTTNSSGSYSANVTSGTYNLAISGSNTNFSLNLPEFYNINVTNYAINQNTTQDITLPAKKVSVHIQDGFGNPVSGIQLTTGNVGLGSLSLGGGLQSTDGNTQYAAGQGPTTDASGNAVLWLFPTTYNLTATPPAGSIYSQFVLSNVAVTNDQTELISLQYSHTPPVTTATLSPSPNSNGIYPDPVSVTLTATATSGYTVANTYYTVDGGAQQTYTAPFSVSGGGSHTITYWSIDNSGVQESHNSKTLTVQSLSAPTNLAASSPTQNPVLTWTSVSGANSYNIYRNGSKIGSGTNASYTDNSAPEGTDTYYVTAVNVSGEGPQSNTISVLVDRTAPTITYTVAPAPNSNGWNNTSVLVTFSCNDASSGVASCTNPVILNSEGANQTVTGTATDNAGNTASVMTAPINIDETVPALGTASWSSNPIDTTQSTTLTIPVSDNLSGVTGGEYYTGTDPGQGNATAMTLNSGNLSASFGPNLPAGIYTVNYRAEDAAGNWDLPQTVTLTVKSVAPTNLTAPSPTNSAPALSWTAVSGVDHYDVYRDGSKVGSTATTHYTDSSATEGSHSYYVTAITSDGVSSDPSSSITVVFDQTNPTITYTVNPALNSNGWDNSDATVTFNCNDALSGVASCTSPVTVSTEGANQTVTGTATDNAGNTATATATIKLDKTAPAITYSVSPVPNTNGWDSTSVMVSFSCSDALSGVATCTSPIILNSEGANQTVTGTATDNAGNTTSVSTGSINIDETPPTLGTPSWDNNPITTGQSATLTVPVTDSLSGVATGEYYIGTDPGQGHATAMSLASGNLTATFSGLAAGTYAINYRAVDAAGNWDLPQTTTLTVKPLAPTGLTAPSPTNTAPALSWTAVSGVDHYDVYRDGTKVGSAPSTTYTDSTATEGSHSYYVIAVTTDGTASDPSNSITVIFDQTKPTITYSVSPAANGSGWNNSAVTVTFTCGDTLSGVASCTSPVTLSTDGANQTVTGTATDRAGNTATVTTAPINIDQTAPTITYTLSPAANSNGWNSGNVTVTFHCGDALSGVASCSSPVTVNTEGANQTVTGTATDKAGNTASAAATVNIDKTTPTISYSLSPAATSNGWNNGNVTVTFNCADVLSGIASCSSPVTLSTEGANQTVTGTATDKAGNTATTTATVNIDKTAPTISYTVAPAPNSDGWNKNDVTVTFTCNDALSGIASCTGPITIGTDGANQAVTGTAVDKAGNTTSVTAHVNVDETAPTITASVSTPPNSNGWNNGAVTISFTCSDANSGVASCTSPTTITSEGANQVVTGTAVDNAGNTATTHAIVSIDKTKPTIVATQSPAANANGWNNTNVVVTFTCSDSLSGIQSCTSPVTLSSEGTNQSATGTAVDNAGNTNSVTLSGIKIDKTAPTISSPHMTNTTIIVSSPETLSANVSDNLSGVVGGEFYIDTDPGQGNGIAMTYSNGKITANTTISNLGLGVLTPHKLYMRSKDAAGNWSTPVFVSFTYTGL